MRAMAFLLALFGSAGALAQDRPPAAGPATPEFHLLQWSFGQDGRPTVRRLVAPQDRTAVDLAGRPSAVCSVKLLEMPIPQGEEFTMKVVRPPKMDERIFANVPAPACP
jgi:hypothetical protein